MPSESLTFFEEQVTIMYFNLLNQSNDDSHLLIKVNYNMIIKQNIVNTWSNLSNQQMEKLKLEICWNTKKIAYFNPICIVD